MLFRSTAVPDITKKALAQLQMDAEARAAAFSAQALSALQAALVGRTFTDDGGEYIVLKVFFCEEHKKHMANYKLTSAPDMPPKPTKAWLRRHIEVRQIY